MKDTPETRSLRTLRTLLPFARPYRNGILAGMLLIVVADGFGALVPWMLGRGIDVLSTPDVTGRMVLQNAVALVLFAAIGGAGRYGMRQRLNGISRRIENDLRDDLFDHLLRLDAGFYGRMRTGDLMSRATNDTNAVRMAIGPGVMYMVNTIVATTFALLFMLRYHVGLTLISLVPIVLLAPVMLYFSRRLHRGWEQIQEHFGDLQTMVQENLSGVRIVRAYVQEHAQEREFEVLNRGYLEKNMAVARIAAVFHPLLSTLATLGLLAVFWFGGNLVMAGAISAGDFISFGIYLAMLIWPMMAIGWVTNLFQRGAAALARIQAIRHTQPAVTEPVHATVLPHVRGAVEFRAVSFRYPGSERLVLEDVSFRIEAGETAALVGPTGAGKSTIVALLTRRYDPTSGAVLLDDVPLPELSLAQLRSAIGIVPQDAFVFSETIAENIALGLPRDDGSDDAPPAPLLAGADSEYVDRRIEDAARIARLTETITAFPRGFATRLGERGVNLSGGQRQRATLARALARDPAVLILDDALSAVDTHTEREILEGLHDAVRARTALIISHRVSAVMNADRILVIDDGRIVERGRHDALIARGGLYAQLLHRQLLAERLDEDRRLAASDADL
jgi:ATP-binding cassette subfamily B protein